MGIHFQSVSIQKKIMKLLFVAGAALAQYSPEDPDPVTPKPDPPIPDHKGVQSINNCWGGEGPVYNPNYQCGSQFMVDELIHGKVCTIKYSPSGDPGTFEFLEYYDPEFFSLYAGSGAYVVADHPKTKYAITGFPELTQAPADGPSNGSPHQPIPLNLKFEMPQVGGGLWDNSTCCTEGTGDTESDSSDNFQVDCYEEEAKCRLLENINADGEHNRYNFAVGGFDADLVKSITVTLNDKLGNAYACDNFRLMTDNGASCALVPGKPNTLDCSMDNFGQLNLWFGCDGVNATAYRPEQPSIWESSVSCTHYEKEEDDEEEEEEENYRRR